MLLLFGGAAATSAPAQPRSVVATAGTDQVSVAFAAPPGQNLLTETFTGSINARWTVDGTGSTSIVSDKLRMAVGVSTYARALLADDYPVDVEICGQITINQDQQMFPLVSFRGDGVWDTAGVGEQQAMNNGFYLSIRPDTNVWSIFHRASGGSDTLVATAAQTIAAGDVINFIIQADSAASNNVRLRLWVQGATEPVAYALSTETAHAARTRLGLSIYGTVASTTVDWDNFRLGDFTSPSVIDYTVTLSPGGYTATGTASPIVVTAPIGTYTAVVTARNANGSGPASFSSPSLTITATGTVAKTLGALSASTAGTLGVTGSVARTLVDLTSDASGGGTATAGTVALTLDPLNLQAAGAHGNTGTLARTLGNTTSTAAGTVGGVIGAVAVTLDSIEVNAPLTDESGDPITDESGNPILVRGAEGSHGIGGTLAGTLGNLTSSGVGTQGVPGAVAVTLANVTSTTTAGSGAAGTLSRTLANATSTATGTQGVPGSLAETLDDATVAAAGTVTIAGTANITLENATSSASGTSTPPDSGVAGNVAVTLDNVIPTATGASGAGGTLAEILADAVAAAGGSSTAGQVVSTLADLTAAASGTEGEAPVDGLAAIVLADVTSTTVGVSTAIGVLARTLTDLVAFGVGSATAGTVDVVLADVASTAVGAGAIVDFQVVSIRERFHVVSIREMN